MFNKKLCGENDIILMKVNKKTQTNGEIYTVSLNRKSFL